MDNVRVCLDIYTILCVVSIRSEDGMDKKSFCVVCIVAFAFSSGIELMAEERQECWWRFDGLTDAHFHRNVAPLIWVNK